MKKKLAVAAGILSLLAGLTLLFGRGWLGERAYQRALDQNAGVDQSAKLGDGLHVYMCGTGSPMPDVERAGPCIGVLAGKQAFVVDAGSGSIRKLQRMGFPIERLQAVYLTHLHSDHIDGLGELMLQAWVAGRRNAPLPITGPQGTEGVIAGFNAAYTTDSGFRVAHHGEKIVDPGGFGGAASAIPMSEGVESVVLRDQDGVKIIAFLVDHGPIKPAYGYRIEYQGRSIAISGDTVYSPSLVRASKGADVLLHEAMNMKMVAALGAKLGERGQANNAQIMTDIQNYHTSPEDAARAAKEAGVKTLVLYHLVPSVPSFMDTLFLGDAPKRYSGPIRLAKDGMLISLPAGGKDTKFSQSW